MKYFETIPLNCPGVIRLSILIMFEDDSMCLVRRKLMADLLFKFRVDRQDLKQKFVQRVREGPVVHASIDIMSFGECPTRDL